MRAATVGTTATAEAGPGLERSHRAAGIGGVVFALIVIVQNIVWGSMSPANDASAVDVTAFFTDNETLLAVMFGALPVAAIALFVWAAGMHAHLRKVAPTWSTVGLLGVTGIGAMFSTSSAVQVALAARVGSLTGAPELVEVLWSLHNAAFTFSVAFIGIALIGMSVASVAAGLLPSWFAWVGPVGGVVMLGATVPMVQMTATAATLPVALLGFLVWITLVGWTGLRLVGRSAADARSAIAG